MTKRNRRMNLLYLPALGLVLMFVLLPLLTSIKTSFYNWNGYSPVKKFIGMKNYLDLLQDENFKTAFFEHYFIWLWQHNLAECIGIGSSTIFEY